MPYGDGYGEDAARHPLHAAAQDGRLTDLAVGLCKKEATGQLEAGTPSLPPHLVLSHPRACVAQR